MTDIHTLAEQLETLNWNMPHDAILAAADLITTVSWEQTTSHMRSLTDDALDRCAWESHETSTHYKWLLHRGRGDAFQMWLHEYKSPDVLRPGYASSIHDHRYWFASKLLIGGFTQTTFEIRELATDRREVHEVSALRLSAGQVYVVDPDMIHSISDFEHPTLTLLVRTRATKPFSTEVRREDGRLVHYYPLRTRIRALRERIAGSGC